MKIKDYRPISLYSFLLCISVNVEHKEDEGVRTEKYTLFEVALEHL